MYTLTQTNLLKLFLELQLMLFEISLKYLANGIFFDLFITSNSS